jgi:cyclophilin family peptidyl-prolyl cis-trans isomerase
MLDSAPFLDGQYTVFGNVVKGMDVVDKISQGDKVTTVSAIEN